MNESTRIHQLLEESRAQAPVSETYAAGRRSLELMTDRSDPAQTMPAFTAAMREVREARDEPKR